MEALKLSTGRMATRLKYALPSAQMVLSAVLLSRSHHWRSIFEPLNDMPGPAPAFTLLWSINAPISWVLMFTYGALQKLWVNVLLVALIGAFWYWIALNFESWQERQTLSLFRSLPLRFAADLLLIALGARIGWSAMLGVGARFGWSVASSAMWDPQSNIIRQLPWAWFIPAALCVLVWSSLVMFMVGNDLVRRVLSLRRVQVQ
jgi:hypothetical protein